MTKRKTVAIIPYIQSTENDLSFLVQIRDNNTTHWPNAYWSFGGGLEGAETHQQAAEREFGEEIVIVKIQDAEICDVRTLPGDVIPVTKKDGSFLEIESDVSIKRMYCLDGSQCKHAKNGSFLAERVKAFLNTKDNHAPQVEDGEYLVALEGVGSRWLTETEIIAGHELLPQPFRNDLLVLADIIKSEYQT